MSWCLAAGSEHEGPTYPIGHAPGCVRHSPSNTRVHTMDLWYTRDFGVASPLAPGDTLCVRPNAWIRILLTLLGCPCLVSLLGLSFRAGYPSLYRITLGVNGKESARRTSGRSVAIAMTPGYLSYPGITQNDSFYSWASVPQRILFPLVS